MFLEEPLCATHMGAGKGKGNLTLWTNLEVKMKQCVQISYVRKSPSIYCTVISNLRISYYYFSIFPVYLSVNFVGLFSLRLHILLFHTISYPLIATVYLYHNSFLEVNTLVHLCVERGKMPLRKFQKNYSSTKTN